LFINLSSLFSHILFAFSSGYPERSVSTSNPKRDRKEYENIP
jgi:hypothetical protein